MRAPIIAALVLALAAPVAAQTTLGSGPTPNYSAPKTSTPPMGRSCQCGGAPNNWGDSDATSPSARNAARQVAGYNAKIRAIDRAPLSVRRAQAEVRARLVTLRNRAAARLQASYGRTEGVPHGTSIPDRDR